MHLILILNYYLLFILEHLYYKTLISILHTKLKLLNKVYLLYLFM